MFAPGGGPVHQADARLGPGWSEPSERLTPLVEALAALLAVSDRVAQAVARHDRASLEACNERAGVLLAQVEQLATVLTPEERALLPEAGVPELRDRLTLASRRNALLIENAWATDAALMRLLIGNGKSGQDAPATGYETPHGPAYVDRGA